jgi:hypothetical protein
VKLLKLEVVVEVKIQSFMFRFEYKFKDLNDSEEVKKCESCWKRIEKRWSFETTIPAFNPAFFNLCFRVISSLTMKLDS